MLTRRVGVGYSWEPECAFVWVHLFVNACVFVSELSWGGGNVQAAPWRCVLFSHPC